MNSRTKVTLNRFFLGVAFLLIAKLTNKISTNLFIIGLVIMIILALGYYVIMVNNNRKTKN